MKKTNALLINFSHKSNGNTSKSLKIIESEFSYNNIKTNYLELSEFDIKHCTICNNCIKKHCSHDDDFHIIVSMIKNADIVILGSPIYVGSITSLGMLLIQRLTYYSKNNDNFLQNKIGSPVIVAGEAGHLSGYNQLTNFYIVNGMIIVGSDYWPVHTSSSWNRNNQKTSDRNLVKLSNNIINIAKGR